MIEQADILLTLKDINKTFGVVHALKNMNLTVKRGRVHTLLGENGAGKSTLMKILAGVYHSDSGEILLNNKRYKPSSPQDAIASGLSAIDSFYLDKLINGWKPNQFVDKTLIKSLKK